MNSYHVLELVGEGSFGRVYKGRKRFTGQVVALKFIPKVGRSEKELRSLKREIDIMRGLQHPNIVQMFDSFETETEVVVVTEYAEGELFQILQDDGNLPESQVHEIACQLVSALYYLHSHRILHRDMKPQNILLGKGGIVKLCDFGFARAMSVSTLVLTSIKGTPLYMSPELVEEKPYDHTADLWSLGCILYELHTGAPPFYTNSIFQLVHLILRDPVKWPDTMSQTCTSFLKGLLTKNPQKRLTWPDLLHHPFVADGVIVLPDTSVFSPLTVPPSPDVLALKHQQLMEKTLVSGQSRLLYKAREQKEGNKKNKQKVKCGTENGRGDLAPARPVQLKALSDHIPVTPNPSEQVLVLETAKQCLISSKTKNRGQISKDYEQEFPSVEVGPRLMRSYSEDSQATLCGKENQLDEETAARQSNEALDRPDIITELKNKLLAFKSKLVDGDVAYLRQIQEPLRDLHKLIMTSDLVNGNPFIGNEFGLPYLLFELLHLTVDHPGIMEQPWSWTVLEQMMLVLLSYWERHWDWVKTESRLEEFSKPFVKLVNRPSHNNIIPLAASVLFMFIDHVISVDVGMDTLPTVLKHLFLLDKAYCTLPPHWGVFDGLLSLVYYILTENENDPQCPSLSEGTLRDLWIKISASLEKAPDVTSLCSIHGLYTFLSMVLFVFTKDPHMCVPLFTETESKCIYTLGLLLDTKRVRRLAPCRPHEESALSSLSVLSCHLLCFPFALDIPSKTMAGLLQLYYRCGVVQGLLQMIHTLPLPLLELPLSLLSRLLLCDPGRSVPCLQAAATACGFFSSHRASQPVALGDQSQSESRTASSLLAALLCSDELWDSAVELLTLLAQVLRCSSRPAGLRLHLEPATLRQGLAHSQERIRAATCSVLGSLEPFDSSSTHSPQPALFRDAVDRLRDPCTPVRRMACRAVGNWLGFIGEAPALTQGGDHEEQSEWIEAGQRTAGALAPLLSDPDALTRRHCCAALGNLANVSGGASVLMKEDVPRLLLAVACLDSHHAVRQAAIVTLRLYCQHDAVRQVLISLDAYKRLLQASDQASPQCDYLQLIDQLGATFAMI